MSCFVQLEMRDIGVVLMTDKVFVYMTGENDTEPHFESQTSMISADFKTWCLTEIDKAISMFMFLLSTFHQLLLINFMHIICLC